MKEIDFEPGLWGKRAVIKSLWKDSFLRDLLENNIVELELNTGKGWDGDNIDFLKFMPNLRSFVIIDFKIKSIAPVHHLTELRNLTISTYCKTPINFSSFPMLESCGFEWRKGSDSLFNSITLKKLGIINYDKNAFLPFSNLYNLETLTILNSAIDNLDGLALLHKLKVLSFGDLKKLTALEGIEGSESLEELEIQRCKNINSISNIFDLNHLKRVLLIDSGNIESIKGIERLSHLETFLFYESTNIVDGDISPLFKLKNLSQVSFKNRRHYTHKREDFGRAYSGNV